MFLFAQAWPEGTPWWVIILVAFIVLPAAAWLGAFINTNVWPFIVKRAERQLSADEATAKALLELILEVKNARNDIADVLHAEKSNGMAIISLDSASRALLALKDPDQYGRRATDRQADTQNSGGEG